MTLDRRQLAACIDHTLLKPTATRSQVAEACRLAREWGCASVCVAPRHVASAHAIVAGSPTKVCTVIGFPTGASMCEIKVAEASQALADGARELDMVIAIGALLEGDTRAVSRDIEAVVSAANRVPGSIVKVILETAALTEQALVQGCQLACEAGADFVKTSTGFGPGGASIEAVRSMARTVAGRCQVKASGGIRSAQAARAMLAAGATRLGTSSTLQILEGWEPTP